jgi:hypothetical protein
MFKTKPFGQAGSARRSDGACGYRDTHFNLDSHVVAVAEKKLLHFLDCIGCVSHATSCSLAAWLDDVISSKPA